MSISPAQSTIVPVASDLAAETEKSLQLPAAGATQREVPAGVGGTPAQVEPSGPTLSTALRVDDQRHVYYEVINNRTGAIVCEIPPEQIRKLEEETNVSPGNQAQGRTLDVQS